MKQLQESWLIQRLQKPMKHENPFAFGGGYKNGGLSDEAFNMMRGIFSFDYMGAAEYEFGAVPKAFQVIAKNRKAYSTFKIVLNKKPVYVIGETDLKDQIIERLKELSKGKVRIKGSSHFDWALGLDKWFTSECRTFGWLEINNGFMFFTDEAMFKKTADLFGLNSDQNAQVSDTTEDTSGNRKPEP